MKNKYLTVDDTVILYVNHKGKQTETLISRNDLHIVENYSGTWYISGDGYVAGYTKITPGRKGKKRGIKLHRLIMDAPESLEVDHINRIKTDNRRENLRLVTTQENLQNKGNYKNSTSGIKGVSFKKSINKWRAYVSIGDGKQKHLGYFETQKEAEQAILANGS